MQGGHCASITMECYAQVTPLLSGTCGMLYLASTKAVAAVSSGQFTGCRACLKVGVCVWLPHTAAKHTQAVHASACKAHPAVVHTEP